MKQRPILFSPAMVRAILEGRKTQTRRIVKPQPWDELPSGGAGYSWSKKGPGSPHFKWNTNMESLGKQMAEDCPYGQPGYVLWVRETWRKYYFTDEYGCADLNKPIIEYAADNPEPIRLPGYKKDGTEKMMPWRPSIHMPFDACRLFLRITDIRVERLQDITEEDAKAEGAKKMHLDDLGQSFTTYKRGFQSIWESINGPDSWQTNPYVWVVSFESTPTPP